MIDLALLRRNPEALRALCQTRGCDVDIDELLDVDTRFRRRTTALNEAQAERRKKSVDASKRDDGAELKKRVAGLEREVSELRRDRDDLWARLPNLLAPDTPQGGDDSGNQVVREWGELPAQTFPRDTHERVGERLGILDLKRGSKVSGAGFYYWVGDGARLVHGLFSLALEFLRDRGFTELYTPLLTRPRTLFGTGYLPFFADETYKVEGQDLHLIGTSEQTLVGYRMDETIAHDELPLRYTAFSACFRTEAGAYGKESRGSFRVHQFHKVEQIVFCHPDESEHWLQECLRNEEDFMQLLGIPYRVVRVCVGDLGAPAYKKYDVEAWFAGFDAYRETHSDSNLLDYQTRRLSIRWKDGSRTLYPHTISATMITDRAALAILENSQQPDGSVVLPEVLVPHAGKRVLKPLQS